jgi:hypothetical protein
MSILNLFFEVYNKAILEYKKSLTKKLLMIDAFLLFTIVTALIQAM